MKQKIIIPLLLITLWTEARCSEKPHKMNKKEFMQQWETDSVSQQIITFYFNQHQHAKMLMLFIPVNMAAIVFTPMAIASPILTMPLAGTGARHITMWERRQLVKDLVFYSENKLLSPHLKNKMIKAGFIKTDICKQ